MQPQVIIGLNAVIVAVTEEVPRILTVQRAEHALVEPRPGGRGPHEVVLEALPFGPFDPASDRTLELGLRRWVREQTGLELGYVEQLYTFGNRNRDPLEREGGPRVISVAYLALVREGRLSGTGEAIWRDWYRFFPWEDWRSGRPRIIESEIIPALEDWIRRARDAADRRERRERSDIHFGLHGAPWVAERALDRYELIYETGLAAEAQRDLQEADPGASSPEDRARTAKNRSHLGQPMALDHRRILASALGRMRGKLKYRPVVFELLPSTFTLLQLQRVVEALAGARLHKQNLRRLVEHGGLVEGTAGFESRTGGRPAELFRFRREVLRERPAPGVGLPTRHQSADIRPRPVNPNG
jgi:hypothetical protein